MRARRWLILAVAGAVAGLGGCVARMMNPQDVLAGARTALPSRFAHQAEAVTAPRSAPSIATDIVDWPKAYGDERLEGLILTVLNANQDLVIARARLKDARAGAVQVASTLWPTIDLAGFGAHQKQLRNTPTPNVVTDSFGVDLQASWELDVLGGNRDRKRAARLDAEAAQANMWGVRTVLVADVTATYLELAGTDARLAVLDRNIAVEAESLRLAQGAFNAGLAINLTVQRATARLAATQALRPPLEQTRAALVHRLAVLMDSTPEQLLPQFADSVPMPTSSPADPSLAPSDLLTRRPDVRAAHAQLLAAAARARAARTDLLPKFFLSAATGRESVKIAHLPELTDPVYFLGASVSQTIFAAGRIRAQVVAQDARLEAAAAAYRQAFLKALEDVEDAYTAVAAANLARARFGEAAQAARVAEAQARRGFELGRVDYSTLLDVQRERLAAEDGEVQARTAVAVAYTALFRAFGGGWDVADAASPAAGG